MDKPLSYIAASMAMFLSTSALCVEHLDHMRYPIVLDQSAAGPLAKIDLSLTNIAELQSAHHYQVLDAAGHAMPTRLLTVMQPVQTQQIALRAYHWPMQPPTTRAAAASLELQLNQDDAHAWVTWPDQRQRPHDAAQTDQSSDQMWLLALPDFERYQALSAQQIILTWPSAALSIQASLEGSQDLINWTPINNAALLDTGQSAGAHGQLKQSSIAVDQLYRYWRLSLSSPLTLSQAAITMQDAERPIMQSQQVIFQKTTHEGTSDRWRLSLPSPVAVQGLRFNLPLNQVWSLTVSTPQLSPALQTKDWRSLVTRNLSHWQNPPAGEPALNNTMWLDGEGEGSTTRYAREWQISGLGPKTDRLSVSLIGEKQSLYFVPQGQAPYQLELNRPELTDGMSAESLNLPKPLPSVQTATLGAMQAIPAATPWKSYGLWAVLIAAVGVLGLAALRLLQGLDQQKG